MTTKELENKVSIRKVYYGKYVITIEYGRKNYTCQTSDSVYYDIATTKEPMLGITYKQALIVLYEYCKRKNHLGEYK